MTKTIELTGDWDIPEGFLPKAEVRITKEGDYVMDNLYSEIPKIGLVGNLNYGRYAPCLIPERKVIDWQKIIDNKVLCEFSDYAKDWYIGYLYSYDGSFFKRTYSDSFKYCRPAQNILFGHNGGECPLPEGIKVMVNYRSAMKHSLLTEGDVSLFNWINETEELSSFSYKDIVSYKILGLSEGYSYE